MGADDKRMGVRCVGVCQTGVYIGAQNSWSTSFTPVQYHGRIWLYDLLGWWSSGKKIEREKRMKYCAQLRAHRFYTEFYSRALGNKSCSIAAQYLCPVG